MKVFRVLGSLELAVVLLATYIGVLAWGTLVEKWHGPEAAHSMVYGTGWFLALGAVLAANVFCSMLIRFPWRRRQIGFLLTHGGILVLLAGCWVTWQFGVQAQLPVYEGHTAHTAYLDSGDAEHPEAMDLGFQVRLHRFQRKLDPGASMPSHYSSLVDFLDRSDPPQVLSKDVLITLNAPVDFTDPKSGRTYRLFQSSFGGPVLPGGAEFDQLVGGDRSRDHVYLSRLSVNYDPGRWLKYAGSFLIVIGILIIYRLQSSVFGRRVRATPDEDGDSDANGRQNCPPDELAEPYETKGKAATIVLLSLILASVGGTCQAAGGTPSAWDTWRRMPVLGEGRVVPLDTFAVEAVEAICGRANPTLQLPDGNTRTYPAAELLFAWLAEPERWEKTPFLPADDRELREEVLGLPLYDEDGRRLRFAAPADVEHCEELARRWANLERRSEEDGKDFRLTGVEKKIMALVDAYSRFRALTYDPNTAADLPQRFFSRVQSSAIAWRTLAGSLQGGARVDRDAQVRQLMVQAGEPLQKLLVQVHGGDVSRAKVLAPVASFRQASEALAAHLAPSKDRPLAALAADMCRQTTEMQLALYDGGETLRLVPALNPGALEQDRDPSDDASPWLSFQAMIDGSDDLLRGYPQPELKAVRKAWSEAKEAYRTDNGSTAKQAAMAEAVNRFADAVRALAERIEPLRQGLPCLLADQDVIDATVYPPPGSTDAEVFYNKLNPFFWAWVVSLAATICLLVAVGRIERPMFWLGMALLITAQAFTATGLALRGFITELVPLTGMFETVVFVALYAALLGAWYVAAGMRQSPPATDTAETGGRVLTRWERGMLQRRPFAVAGAIVSFVALVLAYYAPATVMHRRIGAVTPILRDNFWLAVHVVTIMASYASAAIALILGNMALGHYLFGRFTTTASGRRPPEACHVLAGLIYTAVQITVLLLAAGTVLGAFWADKAWGRFWAWDPKEVWALISLLVYIAILHARHIGWAADFGMALAAVLGATAVLFTWYGVNFLLGSGLHSYGAGAGGQWAVTTAVALQWLFLAFAAGRYAAEMRDQR